MTHSNDPMPRPDQPPAPGGYPASPPATQGYGGAGPVGKQRNGIAVVFLSLITLGIYWLVYIFKTSKEIKNNSGIGVGPG
ncbi:MAG: DUF4234 domain-containing protein, partial [Jatrophihabitantaceae bacterium]